MKNSGTIIRKQLLTAMMVFSSVLSISMARFEQNPQSCGMIITDTKKKKPDVPDDPNP